MSVTVLSLDSWSRVDAGIVQALGGVMDISEIPDPKNGDWITISVGQSVTRRTPSYCRGQGMAVVMADLPDDADL